MPDNRVPDDVELTRRVEILAGRLVEKGWTMCAAESCTGGWIAKCCTDLPGSSAWFERGMVSYSNEAKHQMLGVEDDVLAAFGAVSKEVALAMAAGARKNSGTDLAVAVTGIAGPGGGTPDKPVGMVWFSWATRESVEAELRMFPGDRDAVRRLTVEHALQGLIDRL